MKKLCLIILILLSFKGYSQTTSWSSSPVTTWQNRLFGGSPQLRGLIGTSNVFSLSDSLNARPTLAYSDARYIINQGSIVENKQFYVNNGGADLFFLGGYFIGNRQLSTISGGIIIGNQIAFGKNSANNAFAFMGSNYKIATISSSLLSANSDFKLPNVSGDTLVVRANLALKEDKANKVTTLDSSATHYASTSAIKTEFAGAKINFSSGSSNPVTITYASYAATYGNHPTFVVHGIIGGNDVILNSVQPVVNYLSGVISSIYFYLYPINFNGYILIKP